MQTPILITRPAPAADALAQALKDRLGADCRIVLSPLLRIELLDEDLSGMPARTLIFTSAHAVRAFARVDDRRDLRCYAVGVATAKVASAAGFQPIIGEGTGAELAKHIIADGAPQPCLYPRGENVAYDVASALNSAGIETFSKVLYRQASVRFTQEARKLLSDEPHVIVPLFSPRSATQFFMTGPFAASLHIVAMSESVAKEVPQEEVTQLIVAARPDIEAMLEGIAGSWVAANQLERRDPAQ